MLDSRDRKYSLSIISARLMTGLLCLCLLLVNIPVSYAEFASDGAQTFTASVTIPPFVDSDYDGIPDERDSLPVNYENADADDEDDIKNSDGISVTNGLTELEEYRLGDYNPRRINARIIASLISGPQPLDVILTAEVTDNGGYDIVKYEWDFDGNGTYDYSTRNLSVSYKFTSSGGNNIKLRVTNAAGAVGVVRDTINVLKIDRAPSAILDQMPINPKIPSKYTFSGAKSNDITLYQWDLTGNGEYDFTSTKSPTLTYTYRDVKRRSFYTHFKVTNREGLSDNGAKGVIIDSLSWYNEDKNLRPIILFGHDKKTIFCTVDEQITLKGTAMPYGRQVTDLDKFGWVRKLEWDFESDSIYDWAIDTNSPEWKSKIEKGLMTETKHIYGSAGIYRATLRATATTGPTITTGIDITATDHILVIVEENSSLTQPTAVATVSYRNNKDVIEINGRLPVNARFEHSESEEGSSPIVKYEWDFDGDKIMDYSATPSSHKKPKYHYRLPGYYLASLRVTDENGLTDTAYIPVFVYMPDTYASVITMPGEGQTIAGNAVTLTCDVFPDDAGVSSVMFQYKYSLDSGISWSDWNNIGLGERIASYTATWDTTDPMLVPDGNYKIRAIVNGVESNDFLPLSIVVDNANFNGADIYENIDEVTGKFTKTTKINPDEHNSIALSNGTRIQIPAGAIEDGTAPPKVTVTNSADTAGIGNAISVTIEGYSDYFAKDITIIMPYSDYNNDGIVDGTSRNENDMVIMWKNNGTWEPLYDSVVYPVENYVVAKVNHFSLFGIGFITWGASVFGGGGSTVDQGGAASYCFIATAAYGSPDAKDVVILREFRDKFLLTNPLGEKFVRYYYKNSPRIAECIKDSQVLKKIIRFVLKPIVKVADMSLRGHR